MLISVIMPVHNGVQFLKDSVDSILAQTYRNFEFIIIDDGSREPVWDLLSSYTDPRIKIHKNIRNIGLTKSLNICLSLAHGDVIARHDGDDIAHSQRFEKEIHFLHNAGLVSCWAEAIDAQGKTIESEWEDKTTRILGAEVHRLLPQINCVVAPGAMFTRKVLDKIGPFDENIKYAQDYNYWLRVAEFFKIDIVSEVLLKKRAHQNNAWKQPDYSQWVALARQRAKIAATINPVKLF